jgi:hypothetical protein
MNLLNTETPVIRNFIPQMLLNVQDFYFHKVGYTRYDEGIFGHLRTDQNCIHEEIKSRLNSRNACYHSV